MSISHSSSSWSLFMICDDPVSSYILLNKSFPRDRTNVNYGLSLNRIGNIALSNTIFQQKYLHSTKEYIVSKRHIQVRLNHIRFCMLHQHLIPFIYITTTLLLHVRKSDTYIKPGYLTNMVVFDVIYKLYDIATAIVLRCDCFLFDS